MAATANRSRVFIASSVEHLALARAVQENLDRDFECKIWDQDVFRLSQYPLEALLEQLITSDFGIFVLAPDEVVTTRGRNQLVARDNVIFELGLFAGRLGRERTFVIIPRGVPDLHLPSDLMGLTAGDYDGNRRDRNLTAAMGPVCNKIRKLIIERRSSLTPHSGLLRTDLFTAFTSEFDSLIRNAHEIALYFIHSRRWRENHNDGIVEFLKRPKTHLQVFLPDLKNATLLNVLIAHFDDGPHIPGFIADAYRYFGELKQGHLKKVDIRLFGAYPTYSFYRFDDKAIIAMYPTTPIRKNVPAFLAEGKGTLGDFLMQDLDSLLRTCRLTTAAELADLASAIGSSARETEFAAPKRIRMRPTKRSSGRAGKQRAAQRKRWAS